MTLRISTAALHHQGLAALQRQQSALARTQLELTTGNRLTRAAQDPSGAAQAQRIDHAVAALGHFERSSDLLQNRLSLQENALTDANDYLTRARELTVQANNATVSREDRALIASEVRQLRASLLGAANRLDGNGRALFAGQRDGVVPFADTAGVVAYLGDDGRNVVDIGPDIALADADPGSEVFMRARTGDGVIRGTASGANTGTGVLNTTGVTDAVAWGGRSLVVEFTSPTSWRVLDGTTVLDSGPYTDGGSIRVAGVDTRIAGAPAAGDAFTLQPAPRQDVFATLEALADALEAPAVTGADKARLSNALGNALSDIGTAQEHFLNLRAATGARLAAVDATADDRAVSGISLRETLSGLRDTDYAEATSRLSLQVTAIDAAQRTMVRVQSLSLFDKL